MLSSPNSLDPRVSAATKPHSAFITLIYDYLLALDDQLRVVGGLASSWEQADPVTYVDSPAPAASAFTTGTS